MTLMDSIKSTTWFHFTEIDTAVGARVYFASETEQVTHSFKYRAATSLVQHVDAEGFLVASSGNFGQALACACQQKGVPCIVVMPTTSAQVKVDAVRSYNATVIFVDTKIQTRAEKVAEIGEKHSNYHIASPYDCEWVIFGNATLGREIYCHSSSPDMVLVPIGGGGLISGIAQAFQELDANIVLWGAEPALADDAARSLEQGQRLSNDGEPQTLADGARTRSVGVLNWEIIQQRVSNVLRVSEKSICQAMRLFHSVGVKVEPTGALTLGALLEHPPSCSEIVVVISGKNVDSKLYNTIIADSNHVTP